MSIPRFAVTRRGNTIAEKLVTAMELDNGSNFPAGRSILFDMTIAISHMQEFGCEFTDEVIDELVNGEQGEVEEKYRGYAGFYDLNRMLNKIFDGEGK